jgi:hypothetical protein
MKANSALDHAGEFRLLAMQLLVCAEADSRRAAERIESSGSWHQLFDLCQQWKLLAALEARLAAIGITPPEAEAAELARRTQPAFVQTMLCVRAGVIALSALEAAGVRCAGFKGIAALGYLYPGLRSRTLQDTDVLIHPGDIEAALVALEAAGLKRSPEGPLDQYIAFLRNSPGTAGNEAVSLRDEKGAAVDLHWHLGILEVETLLAAAAPVTMLNRPLPLLRPSHAMLLTVHHALRNDFVPGDIARDVCDFAHWQSLLDRTGEWPAIAADAERWGLSAACAALALIVAEVRGVPSPDPPIHLSPADRDLARQLAGFYLHQLHNGPVNTDLAYITSVRPLLQVVSGLATGWTRYRDFMRHSEQSNGEASLTVHERLWHLAKAAANLSPAGWKQVRALGRAKDRIARAGVRSSDPPVDPSVS